MSYSDKGIHENEKSFLKVLVGKDIFRKDVREAYENLEEDNLLLSSPSSSTFKTFKNDIIANVRELFENIEEGNIFKISRGTKYKINFNKYPYRASYVNYNYSDQEYLFNYSDIDKSKIKFEKIVRLNPFDERSDPLALVFTKISNKENSSVDKILTGFFKIDNKNIADCLVGGNSISVSAIASISDKFLINTYYEYLSSETKFNFSMDNI